jgi:TPR repeat protein
MLVIIALLAGLLIALLMTLNSETVSQLPDNLGEPGMTNERQANAETDHNAPTAVAPQPATVDTGPADDAMTITDVAPDRDVAETAPAARTEEMTDAARFGKTLSGAESGNREHQYEAGNMYMTGIGADIDYGKAISFFEKSAGQGYSKAAYQLGLIYYEGSGVSSNKKTAFKWFSSAAENNYAAAQYYLGKLYAAGQGTKRNNKLALEWLGKAVNGGFDQARGEMINVQEKMNMEAAEKKKAAEIARAKAEKAAEANRKKEAQKKAAAIARAKQQAKAQDTAKKKLTKNQQVSKEKPGKAAVSKAVRGKEPAKHNGLEVVIKGAWSRNNKPIAYLPSSINICSREDDRVICLSDDQIRESGGNIIKFQTSAIIDNFDNKENTFKVTYRNLVIDATPVSGTEATGGFKVKPGWGSPHTMDCSLKEGGTVSCLKNNTHSLLLVNTQTAAPDR